MSTQITKPFSARIFHEIHRDAYKAIFQAVKLLDGHRMRVAQVIAMRNSDESKDEEDGTDEDTYAADLESKRQRMEDLKTLREYDAHHLAVLREDFNFVFQRFRMRRRECNRLAKLARLAEYSDEEDTDEYYDSDDDDYDEDEDLSDSLDNSGDKDYDDGDDNDGDEEDDQNMGHNGKKKNGASGTAHKKGDSSNGKQVDEDPMGEDKDDESQLYAAVYSTSKLHLG